MSDYTLPSDSESEGKSPGFLHLWESPVTPSDPGSTPSDPASTPSEEEEDGGGNGSEGQQEDGGGAASDAEDEEEGQEEEEDTDTKFTRLEAQEARMIRRRQGRSPGRGRRVVVRSPTTTRRHFFQFQLLDGRFVLQFRRGGDKQEAREFRRRGRAF